MSHLARGTLASMLACLWLFASTATHAAPGVTDNAGLYDAIERGRQALLAEKYVDAGKALDEALQNKDFSSLPPTIQFLALYFAAFAAQGRDDYLGAHEYIVLATEYPDAEADHWSMRARLAYLVENWADAGNAIYTVAKRWPKSIADLNEHMIQRTAYKLGQDSKLGAARLAMLQELFAAGFKLEWGVEPDGLWQDLALDALQKNDLKRAREVLQRIENPTSLVRMRIDRRFDKLLEAEPKAFDVAAAAAADCKRWRDLARANPRKLAPLVQYLYALFVVGDYRQALELADRALAQNAKSRKDKPAFEDAEDQLNWIYDLRAQAMRGLGRYDESMAAMQVASRQRDASSDKVSQAINLGFALNSMRRPDEALQALDGIDWANTLSGYGRMQLQHVRLRAYLQLGKRDQAEEVLAYLRENKADAQDTWQIALLDWGDTDGAAAQFIARLHDAEQRTEALYSAQNFRDRPRMPQEVMEMAQWQALLDRQDVSAAIDEVGRREPQPIFNVME